MTTEHVLLLFKSFSMETWERKLTDISAASIWIVETVRGICHKRSTMKRVVEAHAEEHTNLLKQCARIVQTGHTANDRDNQSGWYI